MPAKDSSSSTAPRIRRVVSQGFIDEIASLRAGGHTWQMIADHYGTSISNTYHIYRRWTEADYRKTSLKASRYWSAKYRGVYKAILLAAKDTPCVDCGTRLPPECMDLDHVRGDKLFNVGRYNQTYMTYSQMRAEIAKCEVRCPNCHRLRHYRERLAAMPTRQMKMAV